MKRDWPAPKNKTESRGIGGSPFASIRESDRPNIVRLGDTSAPIGDLYHSLIRMSWPRFIALFILVFLFLNLIFAVLYTLDPSGGLRQYVSDRSFYKRYRCNRNHLWSIVFRSRLRVDFCEIFEADGASALSECCRRYDISKCAHAHAARRKSAPQFHLRGQCALLIFA